MISSLIDPLIEYRELTRSENIRKLDSAVKDVTRVQKTLTFYTEFDRETNLITIINELMKEATRFSLYGELCYHNSLKKGKLGTHNWYEYLIMAARNYQKIFELSKELLDKIMDAKKRYMLLFMSIFEFHNAMQHSCSSSLVKDGMAFLEKIETAENDVMEETNLRLHKSLLQFFSFKLLTCNESINVNYEYVKSILSREDDLTVLEIIDLGCILDILESVRLLTKFLLYGEKEDIEKSAKKIDSASQLAMESGRPDLRYIVNKLKISILTLRQLSIWNLKNFFVFDNEQKTHYLDTYIRSKVSSGFYILYPSEYEALVNGILEQKAKNSLISMPTGAGKTLLAELIFLSRVISLWEKRELAIYMVPSRALAHEKYEDFKEAFKNLDSPEIRVCQITGETILDAEKAVKEHDLVILTPEKLDMLLRKQYYDRKIDTLIVDEFHNMRTGYRGIRIEFDIIRHQELYPDTAVILISAIVSNFDEIKNWLGAQKYFRTTWRPTFSRIGIFDIGCARTQGIKFTDGTSFFMPLPQKLRSNAHNKQAISIATEIVKDGPVMIFCSSKRGVNVLADYLSKDFNKMPHELKVNFKQKKKLLLRLKRIIGEDESIYQFFQKGIGIHRGDLPHVIRRIIEEGIRTNALQFIVSTTTLAEGINLPLKTIIIPKTELAGEELTLSLFFNLSGRAGRPQKESEGQVILVSSKKYPMKMLSEQYLKADPKNIEEIVTPVLQIIALDQKIAQARKSEWKQRYIEEKEIHKSVLDTVLLSLVIEKNVAELAENEPIIHRILIHPNKEVHDQVKEILRESENRLITFKVIDRGNKGLKPTKWGYYVYKTGFSPLSCVNLMKHVESLIANLDIYSIKKRSFLYNFEVLHSLFQLMTVPIETRAYFHDGLPKNYVKILYQWIHGKYLKDIAHDFFKDKISDAMLDLGGLLSGFSAWFLYALQILLKYYSATIKRPLGKYLFNLDLLQRYCWFGTFDSSALKILELDISHELLRDDVLRFVTTLGRDKVKEIFENSELIHEKSVQEAIKSMNLQFEEAEFSEILYGILAERQHRR
jgi:replicative superfamily II helicase